MYFEVSFLHTLFKGYEHDIKDDTGYIHTVLQTHFLIIIKLVKN